MINMGRIHMELGCQQQQAKTKVEISQIKRQKRRQRNIKDLEDEKERNLSH